MRSTVLAVVALALLRIVVGMHFFLEGLDHLRDPSWSSTGFRKAAVGPLAEWYRSELPQTGDWSGTLGRVDGRDVQEAAADWQRSIRAGWETLLGRREKAAGLDAGQKGAAKAALDAAAAELESTVASWGEDLVDYRLQHERLQKAEGQASSAEIPFARERVAKQRRELAGKVAGWSREADAIGQKLVGEWDASLTPEQLVKVASTKEPSKLWKADRFVAWSLLTIGACLVIGFLVKFNAMGGVFFLASVIAAQPFWVPGAIATYDQWVEIGALLVIACMPVGGWSGLDYFLRACCPWQCGRETKVRG